MKHIYINSRLHPLMIAVKRGRPARQWIFSQGERWLLLTPGRFARLAMRLGRVDRRIDRIMLLVRRHSPHPEEFCRGVGLEEVRYINPRDYPAVKCPSCGMLHFPHPEDARRTCGECTARDLVDSLRSPSRLERRDRLLHQVARQRILDKSAVAFRPTTINPCLINVQSRRLDKRIARAAKQMVGRGQTYRETSKKLGCSLGVVSKVNTWEMN